MNEVPKVVCLSCSSSVSNVCTGRSVVEEKTVVVMDDIVLLAGRVVDVEGRIVVDKGSLLEGDGSMVVVGG